MFNCYEKNSVNCSQATRAIAKELRPKRYASTDLEFEETRPWEF
jgi:hypothetical protein